MVLGLAVSDLATSLSRLLKAKVTVRWGWPAPMAAALAFVKILMQWWSWYGARGAVGLLTFELFAVVIVATVILFLMAAAALPDEAPETAPVDLTVFYLANRSRFWSFFLGHTLLTNGLILWVRLHTGGRLELAHLWLAAIVGSAAAMLFVRVRWVHAAVMLGLIVYYLHEVLRQRLSG